ncbi:MAG: hypothetical protein GQ564_15225 [Bacteroidales bacterium]|nr:hypothetical protein [Bacteroidales bacterium]
MKDLKNLKGAKILSKNEQKVIKGGEYLACFKGLCPEWYYCNQDNLCVQ